MLMHDPPHPGRIIKRQCLALLKLTMTEATEGLGVSQYTFHRFQRQPGKLAAAADAVLRVARPVAHRQNQGAKLTPRRSFLGTSSARMGPVPVKSLLIVSIRSRDNWSHACGQYANSAQVREIVGTRLNAHQVEGET